jgi:CBS domain-containing protein
MGMFPVCENDRLAGTITDRDIVIRAVAAGCNPDATPVREVMTKDLFYCFDDEDIVEAAQLMEERQIRRLPVLNRNKRLVGIVSLGDLAVRTHHDRLAGEVLESVSEPTAELK